MNTAITTIEVCNDEQRREKVRDSGLSGLDYVEVSEDQLTLSVYFLGKAPEGLDMPNVIIEGGRRVRNIQVLNVQVYREKDPELDDSMEVTVDKAGDFSTYTLRLVKPKGYDLQGRPIYDQFLGVDKRYSQLDFSFKASCPSDLDCQTAQVCPPTPFVEPEINYLAKDYESFRQLILDRLALTIPNWQETHIPDIGIALVEILAYVGDYLSYYQDAVSTEAYLGTARQRISVRRHVRLVDYHIHEGCNARTWLFLSTQKDSTLLPTDIYFISGGSGGVLQDSAVQQLPQGSYQVFEPLVSDPQQPLNFYAAHNEINIYTWGDQECCLPRGATSVTLQDDTGVNTGPPLDLNPGDFLLFEEVKGAKTGVPEDADPTRRWVVRLTSVQRTQDELYTKNVVEVTWSKEDALPFPLCLSAIGPAPKCELIENISVARGNILLVDNGLTICEDLSCVPVAETNPYCDECERQAADIEVSAGPYNPALKKSPLTYSQPLPASAPASQLLTQDPRQALPQITLGSKPPDPNTELVAGMSCPEEPPINFNCCDSTNLPQPTWTPVYDLLESGSEDFNFVVEIDNNGVANLRFGDDELGRAPDPLESFCASYRVGNGSSGNVGAETITTVVVRDPTIHGLTCRNPFAATGGTDSEPISEIKLFAPGAFAADQERAITAGDYAQLAGNYPGVQRAAASLRWTGMNYEALVAVDPSGTDAIQDTLLRKIEHYLQPYRRIGHDVKVVQAQYVPIALAMTICVLPNYLQVHVKAALLAAFSNGILPDGTRGFFHPDNLSFGDSIPVSVVVAAAQAIPGVMSITVNTLERLGEDSRAALDLGVLLIGSMEIAQLDNNPSNPERGTLTLNMRGGR